MKDRMENFKRAAANRSANLEEVVGSLNEDLAEKIEATPPLSDAAKKLLDDSVSHLESGPEIDRFLSDQWQKFADEVEDWEDEHPGITLIIGNIARALAAAGL